MQPIEYPELPQSIPEEKHHLIPVLEALIFGSETPLNEQRIRDILPDLLPIEISTAVDHLNGQYEVTARAFRIRKIAGGYQMFSLPEFSSFIEQLYQNKQASRLTQKALETLSIIAYKQPITKNEMEEIRGVNVDGVVKTLLSRDLVTIAGRAQAPGSPFLYKTTPKFLDYFGLNSLTDLPKLKEIDELIEVEDDELTHHESLLREIAPDSLGMKPNGNGQDQPENNEDESDEQEEKNQA